MDIQEIMILQLQEQAAEDKACGEYTNSRDPWRLLKTRIHELIACSAAMVIDSQQRSPVDPYATQATQWPGMESQGRTVERLSNDPLFHRLVSMQSAGIIQEIERYEKGAGRR